MKETATSSFVNIPEKTVSGRDGRIVVGLVGAWLVIQPWIIGSRFWWSEALNTAIGAVALALALDSREGRRTLWRFPVFWLGLLFCLYVYCQGINPWGYTMQRVSGFYIYDVYTLSHIAWLPSGLISPYTDPGGWRTLVYWLGPWLLVSAWWAAARRRRTGRWLLMAAFLNGVVMALVVIFERFHRPDKILWFYTPSDLAMFPTQYGSFIDHNKTAAFLYLSMGAGFALACRMQAKSRERGRDNGLTWLVLFGCFVILASFFALGSRAGLAVACGVFVGGFFILLTAALVARDRSPGLWLGSLLMMGVVAGWGFFEFYNRDTGTFFRIKYLHEHPGEDTRGILRRETIRMIKPHLWLGWGGGAYRYVSPDYFMEDYYFHDSRYDGGLSARADWAHSDWLQLPFEFGLIGAGLLLGSVAYLYARAIWLIRGLGAEGWAVLLAGGGMLAHATVDFPTYNPAVLLLFSLLLVSTVKTAELTAKRTAKV